jgi:hypothetical protein
MEKIKFIDVTASPELAAASEKALTTYRTSRATLRFITERIQQIDSPTHGDNTEFFAAYTASKKAYTALTAANNKEHDSRMLTFDTINLTNALVDIHFQPDIASICAQYAL